MKSQIGILATFLMAACCGLAQEEHWPCEHCSKDAPRIEFFSERNLELQEEEREIDSERDEERREARENTTFAEELGREIFGT